MSKKEIERIEQKIFEYCAWTFTFSLMVTLVFLWAHYYIEHEQNTWECVEWEEANISITQLDHTKVFIDANKVKLVNCKTIGEMDEGGFWNLDAWECNYVVGDCIKEQLVREVKSC